MENYGSAVGVAVVEQEGSSRRRLQLWLCSLCYHWIVFDRAVQHFTWQYGYTTAHSFEPCSASVADAGACRTAGRLLVHAVHNGDVS
jgi:hypothetical protein